MNAIKVLLGGAALAAATAGCAVSTQQEIQMGQQYSQQINAQLPIVQDPEANRYINVLGDSIARLTSRGSELNWHFFIVDSKEVNAFAVPGGFVYVNRGLIERADHMDELAGVLGHEIGHVVMRHSIKQMQQMQGAQMGIMLGCVLIGTCGDPISSTAINVGGNAVFSKFSRDDETQADSVGIRNVVRAGIDPRGIPEMFRILIAERRTNPGGVDLWFASHPTEEARIQVTDRLIAQIDPAILRTLTKDSPNFHRFKERLMSLPQTAAPRAQRRGMGLNTDR